MICETVLWGKIWVCHTSLTKWCKLKTTWVSIDVSGGRKSDFETLFSCTNSEKLEPFSTIGDANQLPKIRSVKENPAQNKARNTPMRKDGIIDKCKNIKLNKILFLLVIISPAAELKHTRLSGKTIQVKIKPLFTHLVHMHCNFFSYSAGLAFQNSSSAAAFPASLLGGFCSLSELAAWEPCVQIF